MSWLPPVRNQVMWWTGTIAIAMCLGSLVYGAQPGTIGMWLVMAIVAYERAW